MIDISEDYLNTITRIIKKHLSGYEIIAFGSRTTGKAKEFSDLDITVKGYAPADILTLGKIKDELSASDIPVFVDITDWHSFSDSLKEVIEKTGKRLP